MPGEHLHSSMIGINCMAAPVCRLPVAPSASNFGAAGHRRSCAIRRSNESRAIVPIPERAVELAQQVVGRHVAVLELVTVRPDLLVDEVAHRGPHHLELFWPFEHRCLHRVVRAPGR